MDNSVRIGSPPAPVPAALAGSVRSLLRLWPLLAAGLLMAGLLLTLTTVLRQAVTQAQARHAATAARADANFRCNTMAARQERDDCRARAAGLVVEMAAARP
jgi:hypothetical protein